MERGEPGQDSILTLGQIAGAHGVKGWVKVISFTEPRKAILNYETWLLGEDHRSTRVLNGTCPGKSVVAQLEGVTDRDQAEALRGLEISVSRKQLPGTDKNQFYWADLIGLEVLLDSGESLGEISSMMATGANDVMVVEGDRQRLIPFLVGNTVRKVELESGRVIVDWDPEF